MADKEKLTIHKLKFELEVEDKNAYTHYANRVSKLCKSDLPKKLQSVLDQRDIPIGRLVIRKLEIDLRRIPQHTFEKYIIEAIASELDALLDNILPKVEDKIEAAKFQHNSGHTFSVTESGFYFESQYYFQESIRLKDEVRSAQYSQDILEVIDLAKRIKEETHTQTLEDQSREGKHIETFQVREERETNDITRPPTEISTFGQLQKSSEYSSAELETLEKLSNVKAKSATAQLKMIRNLEVIPVDLPPKKLSELDKAFLYYIRYGRLPSNIKYELGMKMQDIFNVNQKDVRFFNEIKKQIARDDKAKERLIRLTDEKNQESLVRKKIIEIRDTESFDPKIPKAFEDYLVALVLNRDLSSFSATLRRYNLNDMVRFFYADNPQKLKSILQFLLKEYPDQRRTRTRVLKLFEKIGKSTIVKIISSFVRKGGFVNKFLNQLNKSNNRGIKEAHASILIALLHTRDPIIQLRKDGFEIEEEYEIEPRIFLKPPPIYKLENFERSAIVDYFLTYGTLPYSSARQQLSISNLSIWFITLSAQQIRDLPYFKEKKYEKTLNHETFNQLDLKVIEHLLQALTPSLSSEMITKYQYFKHHLKSGVPDSFQKTFLLYYALKNKSASYLEEMVNFWKGQFGDDDKIIQRRWKVSEEIQSDFSKLLRIKEVSLADQMKVDYEFQSYSQDISVKNAGLVILWPFLKVYFNMLDLLNPQGDFKSLEERARACHLLQYLAVKQSQGEELYYPLNKILTGYPLDETLPFEITMTEKEIDVSNALLQNVIKQWNALKGGSVDALRGSFLIRDGILVPAPNGWLLTVEKKAYDILMDKLPWGIGMIKLSWAPYVLSVEWERNIM